MCGIDVDLNWLLIAFTAKVYLEVKPKLSMSASGSLSCTNPAKLSGGNAALRLGIDAEIKLALATKAGGRFGGYTLYGRLALEGDLTLDGKGQISLQNPPELTVKLNSDGVLLVGDVVVEGRTARSWQLQPVELIGKQKLVDRKIW